MGISVYNKNKETHIGPNNYNIMRPGILSNPYTEIKDKPTRALYTVSSREEALEKYDIYFDMMYGSNIEFTNVIDEIYEKYKNGEDVYLECCCKPNTCHGDIIEMKLKQRLLREKIKEYKDVRKQKKEMEEIL